MITILELAQELHLGKSTISRKINELGIKEQLTKIDGAYYLSDEQADAVRSTTTHHKATHGAHQTSKRTKQAQTNSDAALIELLNKQLESREQELKALHDEVKELHRLLDQQQQLNLLEKQRVLALEDQQRKQQRGIFARLFGKKDTQGQTEPAKDPEQEEQPNPNS